MVSPNPPEPPTLAVFTKAIVDLAPTGVSVVSSVNMVVPDKSVTSLFCGSLAVTVA